MTMDETVVDPLRELHGHAEQSLRVTVAGFLQAGQQRAMVERERLLRLHQHAEAADELERRRARAEQAAAEVIWSRALRRDWWDQATPEQIGRVYETALSWADTEPKAADALVRIDKELDARFGVAVGEQGEAEASAGPALDNEEVREAESEAAQDLRQGDELEARWREAMGPKLTAQVMGSRSWDGLQARLADLEGKGIDSAEALRLAVEARTLAGARDMASVLRFRLSPVAEAAADAGAGIEAEGIEIAQLINQSLSGNRKGQKRKGQRDERADPWTARQRGRGHEQGGPGVGRAG